MDKAGRLKVGLEFGNVFATPSGNLKCKHVLQVATPAWADYFTALRKERCVGNYTDGVKNCLEFANSYGAEVTSISFPPFSVDSVYNLPADMCAEIMIKTMVKWLRANGEKCNLMNIRICLPLTLVTKMKRKAEEEGTKYYPPPPQPDIHEFKSEDHWGKVTKHAFNIKEHFRSF